MSLVSSVITVRRVIILWLQIYLRVVSRSWSCWTRSLSNWSHRLWIVPRSSYVVRSKVSTCAYLVQLRNWRLDSRHMICWSSHHLTTVLISWSTMLRSQCISIVRCSWAVVWRLMTVHDVGRRITWVLTNSTVVAQRTVTRLTIPPSVVTSSLATSNRSASILTSSAVIIVVGGVWALWIVYWTWTILRAHYTIRLISWRKYSVIIIVVRSVLACSPELSVLIGCILNSWSKFIILVWVFWSFIFRLRVNISIFFLNAIYKCVSVNDEIKTTSAVWA